MDYRRTSDDGNGQLARYSLFQNLTHLLLQNDLQGLPPPPDDDETSAFQLNEDPTPVAPVVQHLGHLLVRAMRGSFTVSEGNSMGCQYRKLSSISEAGNVVVLAQGLAAFLRSGLSETELQAITSITDSSCASYWRSLLGISAATHPNAAVSRDARAALLDVVDMAFTAKVPAYAQDGLCGERRVSPVVYICNSDELDTTHLARQLRLPAQAVRAVPEENFLASLSEMVRSDTEGGKHPAMVIVAYGQGSSRVEYNARALRELCDANGMWLHAEGTGLALLLVASSDEGQPLSSVAEVRKHVHSMSVAPFDWFCLPDAMAIIYYCESPSKPSGGAPLSSLSLWVYSQFNGAKSLRQIVSHSVSMCRHFEAQLSKSPSLLRVNHEANCPHVVVFRYVGTGAQLDPAPAEGAPALRARNDSTHQSALNHANLQFLQRLLNTDVASAFDGVVENGWFCIRFRPPFVATSLEDIKEDTVDLLVKALVAEADLIDASLSCRAAFQAAVEEAQPHGLHLALNPPEDFIGLGCFQFAPPFLNVPSTPTANLSTQLRKDLSQLNVDLAAKLSHISPLFSHGMTGDGDSCVCVGVDVRTMTEERCHALVERAARAAETVDLPAVMIERLSDVIRGGIQEAEKQIKDKSTHNFREEGYLRHIPVVGTLWGFVSPVVEQNVSGCKFDIASAKLDTTEDIVGDVIQNSETEISDDIVLDAGVQLPMVIDVEAGTTVFWEFEIVDKDISFSVFLDREDGTVEDLVPGVRVSTAVTPGTVERVPIKGQATIAHRGSLTLLWDNSFSYFKAKQILYKVSWTSAQGKEEQKEHPQQAQAQQPTGPPTGDQPPPATPESAVPSASS